MRRVLVRVGTCLVRMALADTPELRAHGLSGVTAVPAAGMLFDFGEPTAVSITMEPAVIPLVIAFVDTYGKIYDVHRGEPGFADPYRSKQLSRFVIETSPMWAKYMRLSVGKTVSIWLPSRSQ